MRPRGRTNLSGPEGISGGSSGSGVGVMKCGNRRDSSAGFQSGIVVGRLDVGIASVGDRGSNGIGNLQKRNGENWLPGPVAVNSLSPLSNRPNDCGGFGVCETPSATARRPPARRARFGSFGRRRVTRRQCGGWVRSSRLIGRCGSRASAAQMAARLGLEPRQADSESAVLPLHHRATNPFKNAGAGGAPRTGDGAPPRVPAPAGAGDGTRTRNPLFTKQVLCH